MISQAVEKQNKYNRDVVSEGKTFLPVILTALGDEDDGCRFLKAGISARARENAVDDPINDSFRRKLAFALADCVGALFLRSRQYGSYVNTRKPGRMRPETYEENMERRINN